MADSHDPGAASKDNYVVVARRYRPRGFEELVGQEQVGRALKNAIETGRVGHAYLFTGARGVGKTSTARIFAKALNNPSGPSVTPDNESDTAKAIDSGEDVDVIEIDGASNRGIDEIRSLRANVGVRPSRSRYKIYIIDEVHMLTQAAFNALLKTLEEPPEHVKFIFCTTDPEKIPITVLSRCQRFDFAPVEVSKIVMRLREIVTAEAADADDDALELIARRAAGSMRDSQSLLEQVLSFCGGKLTSDLIHAMLGTADEERLHALALAMANRDPAETLRLMDSAVDAGVDAGRLAEQLLGYFRDLMAVAVGCEASMLRHTSGAMHGELQELAARWGLQTVLAVVSLLDQTLVRIRHSVYGRALLEATLIQSCQLPDLQKLADLVSAASSGAEKKKSPAVSRPSVPAPSQPRAVQPSSPQPASSQAPAPRPAPPTPAASTPAPALAAKPPERTAPTPSPAHSRPADNLAASSVTTSDLASQTAAVALAERVEWTPAGAASLWKAALGQLEAMTESLARAVERVECPGPRRLRLIFPAQAKLAMSRCEMGEHRNQITSVLARLAGEEVAIEVASGENRPAPVAAPKVQPKSRGQRMRELENHDFIKSCIEIFDAEIVRIDTPRP